MRANRVKFVGTFQACGGCEHNGLLDLLEQPTKFLGELCKGSTNGSEPFSRGSNPCSPVFSFFTPKGVFLSKPSTFLSGIFSNTESQIKNDLFVIVAFSEFALKGRRVTAQGKAKRRPGIRNAHTDFGL